MEWFPDKGLSWQTCRDIRAAWMAQYISMFPADERNLVEREARIRSWREREAPQRAGFAGDPRGWEKRHAKTAKLTPLGERLLGLVSWNS
ncbi:hypothetical protein [Mesorhizobium hawassense]|uniref:hypothetical protein n=1 Tax=Mesorhizobium hawassense TaxID=1209954 RepID=UPI0026B96A34